MAAKAKKTKGVQVQDATKSKPEPVNKVDAAQTALAGLSDEQKAELFGNMGYKKKATTSGAAKAREQFKVAKEALFTKMPDIKEILDACEFSAPFSLQVGCDHEGNFSSNLKRLRKREKNEEGDSPAA